MKKITLLILFGFLWSWVSVAQVPIGSQDGTTSNTPITSCQNYSYTQQIVHQDEINAPDMFPWIGFVYTFPEYRGKRMMGKVARLVYLTARLMSKKRSAKAAIPPAARTIQVKLLILFMVEFE